MPEKTAEQKDIVRLIVRIDIPEIDSALVKVLHTTLKQMLKELAPGSIDITIISPPK